MISVTIVLVLYMLGSLLIANSEWIAVNRKPVFPKWSIPQFVSHAISESSKISKDIMCGISHYIPKPRFWSIRYSDRDPYQKLANVPVYYLCNSQGNAFLQTDAQSGDANQRVVTYFMAVDDAMKYLNEVVQSSPQSVNECRLFSTSLESVMKKIFNKKQSRKYGKLPVTTLFRVQPSSRQYQNARKIFSSRGEPREIARLKTSISIPVFSVPGLFCKRTNDEVLFPYYISCEDLLDDAESADPGRVRLRNVEINDLADVLCLSKGVTNPALANLSKLRMKSPRQSIWGSFFRPAVYENIDPHEKALQSPVIMPPRRELEWLRKLYRNDLDFKNEYHSSRMYPMPRDIGE